jgi:hypothetical protein
MQLNAQEGSFVPLFAKELHHSSIDLSGSKSI